MLAAAGGKQADVRVREWACCKHKATSEGMEQVRSRELWMEGAEVIRHIVPGMRSGEK